MSHVLIIDDEQTTTALAQDYLELGGFEVFIVESEKAGMEWMEDHRADVIILEPSMQETDGLFCKQLRKKTDVPIILLSRQTEEIFKLRGFHMGADDYLTKPFSPNELVARVTAHLTRYLDLTGMDMETGKFVRIRDLEIDKIFRKVWLNKKEIFLTLTEFDVLYYLAIKVNQVVSRAEILEAVWGETRDEVIVNIYVRRIREKIEVSTKEPKYIQTIWGAGYCVKS